MTTDAKPIWARLQNRRTAGGIAVVFVVVAVFFWMMSGDDLISSGPYFTVAQGPLTIDVSASGTIQSREQVIVKSEVEGRSTVLWLIAEGQQVKKGDPLIELDSSTLEESKVEQQIRVMNVEAAYIRAREQLEITKNQAQADVSKAELDFRFAEMALLKYEEGEYPQELQQAEADITLAREELQRAEDKLAWSKRLADEGYLTRMEWQADELAARRAEIGLALTESKLGLLTNYTRLQKMEELKSDKEQKKLALDRVTRRSSADIVQAEADLMAKTSEYERQKHRLDKLEAQILKCLIVAPADGMVVYVSSTRGRRGMVDDSLREGSEVRERQELIYLPTEDSMMAEISIHESSLRKVNVGLPAHIRVDARPEHIYEGRVARIGILPDSQNSWLNPDLKVYKTDIFLDGTVDGLRPGMNCRAEIIIEELDEALHVPLQSVLRINGDSVVYLHTAKGDVLRRVETGLDNNRMVHILDGLTVGDQVLLNPPLDASRRAEGPPQERERPLEKEGPSEAAPAAES